MIRMETVTNYLDDNAGVTTDQVYKDLENASSRSVHSEPSDESNSADSGKQLDINNDKINNENMLMAKFYNLQCKECEHQPIFDVYETFVNHCRTVHQEDGELKCCELSFWGRQELLKHMTEHKSAYSCSECGKMFENATEHLHHSKQACASVDAVFRCSHCSKQFNSKYSLAYHANLHLPESERPHRCRHCDKGFGTKHAMAKHERTHLPDAERLSYVCDICGKRFGYASTLDGHQKHVHSDARPFHCPVCAKTFPIKGALTYHLTTHQVQDRVQCTHCRIWLKNEKILQIHKKCHEGEIYQCPHCDKVSSTRNNLRMHVKRHSDERPHPCPLCPRAFKTSRDLKTHTVQHTGLKPYCCPYCPKTFASPSNFYAHRKMKHQTNHQQTSASEPQQYRSDEAIN